MAALHDTEAELSSLVSLSADIRGGVDAITASLGPGPVARAFTTFAAETLFHDFESGMVGSGRAVQSVKTAVAEYAAADEEMRRRAEAAAAAVPGAAGSGNPGTAPPAVRPGIVPGAGPGVEPQQVPPVPVVPVPAVPPPTVPPPTVPTPTVPTPTVPTPTGPPPTAAAPGLVPALPLPLPWPAPSPNPPPQKVPEPEPDRGAIVPLPGPPPWQPARPRKPIPFFPNPLLRIPCWWRKPPCFQRPPLWPGLPRWPHAPGVHRSPWLWGFWPLPGCPCPHRLPDVGFLPPPGRCYPLLPLEIPQLRTDPPVAQMLIGHLTISDAEAPVPDGSPVPEGSPLPPLRAEDPVQAGTGPGIRKWGLT